MQVEMYMRGARGEAFFRLERITNNHQAQPLAVEDNGNNNEGALQVPTDEEFEDWLVELGIGSGIAAGAGVLVESLQFCYRQRVRIYATARNISEQLGLNLSFATDYLKKVMMDVGQAVWSELTSNITVSIIGATVTIICVHTAYDVLIQYQRLGRNEITREQFNSYLKKRLPRGISAAAFSVAGGIAGSFIPVPVVGTLVGTTVGAVIGDRLGGWMFGR